MAVSLIAPGSPTATTLPVPAPQPVVERPKQPQPQEQAPQVDESVFRKFQGPNLMLLPHGETKAPAQPQTKMQRLKEKLRLARPRPLKMAEPTPIEHKPAEFHVIKVGSGRITNPVRWKLVSKHQTLVDALESVPPKFGTHVMRVWPDKSIHNGWGNHIQVGDHNSPVREAITSPYRDDKTQAERAIGQPYSELLNAIQRLHGLLKTNSSSDTPLKAHPEAIDFMRQAEATNDVTPLHAMLDYLQEKGVDPAVTDFAKSMMKRVAPSRFSRRERLKLKLRQRRSPLRFTESDIPGLVRAAVHSALQTGSYPKIGSPANGAHVNSEQGDRTPHLILADAVEEGGKPNLAQAIRTGVNEHTRDNGIEVMHWPTPTISDEYRNSSKRYRWRLHVSGEPYRPTMSVAYDFPEDDGSALEYLLWQIHPDRNLIEKLLHEGVAISEHTTPDRLEHIFGPEFTQKILAHQQPEQMSRGQPLRFGAVPPPERHRDFMPGGRYSNLAEHLAPIASKGQGGAMVEPPHTLLAEQMLRTGDLGLMPMLADYLQEAGHQPRPWADENELREPIDWYMPNPHQEFTHTGSVMKGIHDHFQQQGHIGIPLFRHLIEQLGHFGKPEMAEFLGNAFLRSRSLTDPKAPVGWSFRTGTYRDGDQIVGNNRLIHTDHQGRQLIWDRISRDYSNHYGNTPDGQLRRMHDETAGLRREVEGEPQQMSRGQPVRFSESSSIHDDPAFLAGLHHSIMGDSTYPGRDSRYGGDPVPHHAFADHLEETGSPLMSEFVRQATNRGKFRGTDSLRGILGYKGPTVAYREFPLGWSVKAYLRPRTHRKMPFESTRDPDYEITMTHRGEDGNAVQYSIYRPIGGDTQAYLDRLQEEMSARQPNLKLSRRERLKIKFRKQRGGV